MEVEKKFLKVGGDKIAVKVHLPAEKTRGTIVFCHGFGSDKEGSYKKRCEFFAKNGLKAVRFDFRGNYESSLEFKDATLSTRIEDLERILEKFEDNNTVVHGTSFGGLVSIITTNKSEKIDFLGLRSPVTNLESISGIRNQVLEDGFYQHMPGKKVGRKFVEDLENYDLTGISEGINNPTLLMHGTKDKVIDIMYSETFFDKLKSKKRFIKYGGQGHRFDEETDFLSLNHVLEWFEDESKY